MTLRRLLTLAGILVMANASARRQRRRVAMPAPRVRSRGGDPPPLSVLNTTQLWVQQPLDHFSGEGGAGGGDAAWDQRVFVYDGFTKNAGAQAVFFYVGNEADVTLYVNATGLMWERAEEFGALLVWSEHRYYGESQPFGSAEASVANKTYLSVEQALADHAAAAAAIREKYGVPASAATIGFGGSYGGMLATWLRLARPDAIDGAIAASAPVLSFEGESPACDATFYARGVSYDVTPSAGASAACGPALQRAFAGEELVALGASAAGRETLAQGLRLCDGSLSDDDDAGWEAVFWLNEALSYMSMGNYPYESSYILNGDGVLPPFPVRVACAAFDAPGGGDDDEDEAAWLDALASFAGVYYNSSGDKSCFDLEQPVNPESAIVNELWNWQYCTEIFQLFGQAGPPGDIFWPAPWDPEAAAADCAAAYGSGATGDFRGTDAGWATRTFGGNASAWNTSHLVWSNGELDPWAGGGVGFGVAGKDAAPNFRNDSARGLWAISIPEAAHHLDLMWSDPGDTAAVKSARDFEMDQVRQWVEEKKAATAIS